MEQKMLDKKLFLLDIHAWECTVTIQRIDSQIIIYSGAHVGRQLAKFWCKGALVPIFIMLS